MIRVCKAVKPRGWFIQSGTRGPCDLVNNAVLLLGLLGCALVGIQGGCSSHSPPPSKQEEIRHVQYTPPDIPLARRKQVYREVQKLIHEYEERTYSIRQQFAEGKLSARERDQLLKEATERYEFELKAALGRYGLRMKDLPHILAEARDKGWD